MRRSNQKGVLPRKYLTLIEILDEVLPLVKQKYEVPSFNSLKTLEFHPVIPKVVRPIPSVRKIKCK